MIARLGILTVLSTLLTVLLLPHATAQGPCKGSIVCKSYGFISACESDCSQAYSYCKRNPTGEVNNNYFSEDCSEPYPSANACGADNCYGCVSYTCNPGQ